IEKIKPLHGMCCAPYVPNMGNNQDHIDKFFNEGTIPYCRLHDCNGGGLMGATHLVDTTSIFKDFSADETNSENYDFHHTDEYISAIEKTGCKTYYRLGVSIEWGSKKYTSLPPADFKKWARICEHIIRHYNEGWANGFEFNIEYWEIWNEPENPGNCFGPSMWGGTREEFYELYRISSKYLKSCFPNIKIGGYGSCGFYTETRDISTLDKGFETFVPYFTDFLAMVKENNCPLDFYSWHIYTGDEKELEAHAGFVRKTLDEYGFKETESHLNEWNIHSEGSGFAAKHTEEGASFNAAVLAMLSQTRYVDKAMYYCFSYTGMYNGLLNQNDKSIEKSWYPFVVYGRLYTLANKVESQCDGDHIYAVGASDGDNAGAMISNYISNDEWCHITLEGISADAQINLYVISKEKNFEKCMSFTVKDNCDIKIPVPQRTVIYIEILKIKKDDE
ncbi:MAG: hypothetical protein J6B23_07490, partial [Clostridia bacterium]|nr:hypothetical protein [Clostridia bacterium]